MYTFNEWAKDVPDQTKLVGVSKGLKSNYIETVFYVDSKGRERKAFEIYVIDPCKTFEQKKYRYLAVYETLPANDEDATDEGVLGAPTGFLAVPKSNPISGIILFILFILLLAGAWFGPELITSIKTSATVDEDVTASSSTDELTDSIPSSIPAEISTGEPLFTSSEIAGILNIATTSVEEEKLLSDFAANQASFIALDINNIVSVHNSNLYIGITNLEVNSKSIVYTIIDSDGQEVAKGTLKPGEATPYEMYTMYTTPRSTQKGTIQITPSGNESVVSIDCQIVYS